MNRTITEERGGRAGAARRLMAWGAVLALAWAAASGPAAAQEAARSADGFVDSIGVDTHFGYQDTLTDPYSDYNSCKGWLTALGVRHIRDGSDIQAGSSKLYMQQTFKTLWTQTGIRTTFVTSPNYGAAPADVISMIGTVTPAALDAVEGPNEPDLFSYTYGSLTGYAAVKQWMNDIYPLIKSTASTRMVRVIAPAMADSGSGQEANIAPLNAFDFQATHNYQAGRMPTSTLSSYIGYSDGTVGSGNPTRPIIATESGYSVGSGNDWPISATAQGKYTARLLTEDYLAGLPRTFLYELVQEGGQTFGLLTATTSGGADTNPSYRPAYNAVKNLTATLGEAAWNGSTKQWSVPAFTPGWLKYSLTAGAPSVHHLLLQKSNGDFYLLLWNEVSVYNQQTASDITNAAVPVTLNFSTPVSGSATVWTQNADGTYASSSPAITNNQLVVNVPDSLAIVRISPTGGLSATQTPPVSSLVNAVACGSASAYGNFVPDTGYYTYSSGSPSVPGGTAGTANAIATGGVSNPAPTPVYQHDRDGNTTYDISGLTPNAPYRVRLHFAEFASGSRQFDIYLNGSCVLTNYDIAGSVGMNTASVLEYAAFANSDGKIVVQTLADAAGSPKIDGIEVYKWAAAAYYQANSSANTIGGGAGALSNKVNWLGNGGYVTFNGVAASVAESATLTLTYLNGTANPLTFDVSVNGGAAQPVSCPPSGGWYTQATAALPISLNAGGNTIEFSNPSAEAPDLAQIAVQP